MEIYFEPAILPLAWVQHTVAPPHLATSASAATFAPFRMRHPRQFLRVIHTSQIPVRVSLGLKSLFSGVTWQLTSNFWCEDTVQKYTPAVRVKYCTSENGSGTNVGEQVLQGIKARTLALHHDGVRKEGRHELGFIFFYQSQFQTWQPAGLLLHGFMSAVPDGRLKFDRRRRRHRNVNIDTHRAEVLQLQGV